MNTIDQQQAVLRAEALLQGAANDLRSARRYGKDDLIQRALEAMEKARKRLEVAGLAEREPRSSSPIFDEAVSYVEDVAKRMNEASDRTSDPS